MYLTCDTPELVVIHVTRARKGARGRQVLIDQYHLAERNEDYTLPDRYLCGSRMSDTDRPWFDATVNLRELCDQCQRRAVSGPYYLDVRVTS